MMYIPIGSYSEGTLRAYDVFWAGIEALEQVSPSKAKTILKDVPEDARDDSQHDWWDSEDASWVVNEDLWTVLNRYCPPYCYWGSTEGDGASIGCWVSWDAVREGVHCKEVIQSDEHLDDFDAEYNLVVNDHGNCTLYDVEGHVLWEVV
jgi:hypothetical protein